MRCVVKLLGNQDDPEVSELRRELEQRYEVDAQPSQYPRPVAYVNEHEDRFEGSDEIRKHLLL